MIDAIKLYSAFVRHYFRAQGEYRLNFFLGNIANFYSYGLIYAAFWLMARRFGSIGGWNYDELVTLYSLNILTYAIAGVLFWYTAYNLEGFVTTGDVDRFFLRPRNILLQLACQRFGFTFLGQIVAVGVFAVPAWLRLELNLSPSDWIYLAAVLASGVMIHAGAMIMIGAMSFYIERTGEIGNVLYYAVRAITNYPLTIYPEVVGYMLLFPLPWAFINYYPALHLLGKATTISDTLLAGVAPLVGILYFSLAVGIFSRALRHHTGTGH